jgi:PST family polysaccharide transporter
MVAFGSRVTLTDLVRHAGRSLQSIAVGRFAGPGALGLYSRAETLIEIPLKLTSPLSQVALSALSRLQADPQGYRHFFTRALLAPAAVSIPIAAFLMLQADLLVRVVLGKAWLEAIPVFQLLAPAAVASSFAHTTHWVTLSCGRAERELRWSLLEFAALAAAVAIGVPGGITGVAAAVCSAQLVLVVPRILYALRGTPVRGRDLLGVLWRPALAATAASLAALGLRASDLLPAGALLALGAIAAVFGVAYAGTWVVLPGGPALLRGVLAAARG